MKDRPKPEASPEVSQLIALVKSLAMRPNGSVSRGEVIEIVLTVLVLLTGIGAALHKIFND